MEKQRSSRAEAIPQSTVETARKNTHLIHLHLQEGSWTTCQLYSARTSETFCFRTAFCNASIGVLNSGNPDCYLKGKSFKVLWLLTRKKSVFGLQVKEDWVRNCECMFRTDCVWKYILWVKVRKRSGMISGGDFSWISSRNQLFHTCPWKHYNFLTFFVFPRNGEQLGIICEDNKYDFSLQEVRDMKETLTVRPVGDSPGM